MDTQNTPIHINLWHRDFWSMSLAYLLLAMAVCCYIPMIPLFIEKFGLSSLQTGIMVGTFGLGNLALGSLCSWLVQRYRRNKMFILNAFIVAADMLLMFYLSETSSMLPLPDTYYILLALCFVLGASFGLAEKILISTLVIDKCESFQRTEANHHTSWFGRFAISLGPLATLLLDQFHEDMFAYLLPPILVLMSIMLISSVSFPFKTPDDDVKLFSLDHFFLPQGIWLFLNLLLITTVVGIVLAMMSTLQFYAMLMIGFLIAILSEKFVFPNADLKSETVTGLIAIGFALLLLLTRHQAVVYYLSPILIGFGIGIIGSRFLLFFIKLSKHCQRGTSQSTFTLAWECGLTTGLLIGYCCFKQDYKELLTLALVLDLAALAVYNFFTHRWYMAHRNR